MLLEILGRLLLLLFPLILPNGTEAVANTTTITAFTADWCPACQRDKPRLAELEKQGYVIVRIDPRDQPGLAREYGVRYIPAYFVGRVRVDIHKKH